MTEIDSLPRTDGPRAPRVFAPAVVLCLFVALLPTAFAGTSPEVSSDECLRLADTAAPPGPLAEACSARHPDDVELLAAVGDAYAAGDRRRAEAVYQRVIARDPGHADVRLKLGRLLLDRSAFAEAVAMADAALLVQPNRPELLDLRRQARAGLAR